MSLRLEGELTGRKARRERREAEGGERRARRSGRGLGYVEGIGGEFAASLNERERLGISERGRKTRGRRRRGTYQRARRGSRQGRGRYRYGDQELERVREVSKREERDRLGRTAGQSRPSRDPRAYEGPRPGGTGAGCSREERRFSKKASHTASRGCARTERARRAGRERSD